MGFPKPSRIAVSLEVGPKRRVFAQARDWIGWCRAGKDEESSLRALIACAERYRQVAAWSGVDFPPRPSVVDLIVVERVSGTGVTDFGALASLLESDLGPVDGDAVERLVLLLTSCWRAFDEALARVPGADHALKPSTGRSPDEMRFHLVDADLMHLSAFGPAYKPPSPEAVEELEAATRERIVKGLRALPRNETFVPRRRYGFTWTPLFAVRRSAWHALDHAWELEDRQSGRA